MISNLWGKAVLNSDLHSAELASHVTFSSSWRRRDSNLWIWDFLLICWKDLFLYLWHPSSVHILGSSFLSSFSLSPFFFYIKKTYPIVFLCFRNWTFQFVCFFLITILKLFYVYPKEIHCEKWETSFSLPEKWGWGGAGNVGKGKAWINPVVLDWNWTYPREFMVLNMSRKIQK